MADTDEGILKEYEVLVDPNAETPPLETPPVEPAPTEPVNYDAQFAEIKATYDERERGYQSKLADQNTKLEKLERLVSGAYSQAHPAPVQDAADETFTKEDLVQDAVGTIERVAAARSKKAVKELTDQLNPVVQNLVERGYQSELALVKGTKYYDEVKEKLDKTFVDQPQLKGQAGAVDYAYKMLVGEYMEDHDPAVKKDDPPVAPVVPVTPADPPVTPAAPVQNRTPVSGKPGGGTPPVTPDKIELSAEQARVKAKFAGIFKEMDLDPDDAVFGGMA